MFELLLKSGTYWLRIDDQCVQQGIDGIVRIMTANQSIKRIE